MPRRWQSSGCVCEGFPTDQLKEQKISLNVRVTILQPGLKGKWGEPSSPSLLPPSPFLPWLQWIKQLCSASFFLCDLLPGYRPQNMEASHHRTKPLKLWAQIGLSSLVLSPEIQSPQWIANKTCVFAHNPPSSSCPVTLHKTLSWELGRGQGHSRQNFVMRQLSLFIPEGEEGPVLSTWGCHQQPGWWYT